jgi:hypothetical protein
MGATTVLGVLYRLLFYDSVGLGKESSFFLAPHRRNLLGFITCVISPVHHHQVSTVCTGSEPSAKTDGIVILEDAIWRET